MSEVDRWQGWWESPDGQTLAGELTYSNEQGAKLRAYGKRTASIAPPVAWARALHGRTIGGQDITLLDAALYGNSDYIGGSEEEMPTSQEWRADMIILGAHVASARELRFETCSFRLTGLAQWLTERWGGAPFFDAPTVPARRKVPRRRRRARAGPVRRDRRRRAVWVTRARALQAQRDYRPTGRISGQVQDAHILAWCEEQPVTTSWFRTVTERTSAVQVTLCKPLDLGEWERRWIHPFQDLLVLCTGKPSELESITAHFQLAAPAFLRPALTDGSSISATVQVRRRGMVDHVTPRLYNRMLLPRNAVGADGARFLRDWFALHRRIDRAAVMFFATLNEHSQWLENQLLNLTSFAEFYHERMYPERIRFDPELNRRLAKRLVPMIEDEKARKAWAEKVAYAPNPTQRERLTDLSERAMWTVPALSRFPELVGQLVNTRNHLTHFSPPRKHVVDDLPLARAVQRLVVVLQTNLLLDLGGNDAAVATAIARGYWQSPVLDASLEMQLDASGDEQ